MTDGHYLRAELAAEGVRWAGREVARTAVTVVMPTDDDRAMATFDPGDQVTAGELAAVPPRAASRARAGAAGQPARSGADHRHHRSRRGGAPARRAGARVVVT